MNTNTTALSAGIVAGIILGLVLMAALSGAATAQGVDYYNNSSTTVNNDAWVPGGNATLDNVLDLAARAPGYVIGFDRAAQGDVGAAGTMISGFAVAGIFLGMVIGTSMGVVAGSILALATASVLATVGFLPTWLYGVLLFLFGIPAASAIIGVLR